MKFAVFDNFNDEVYHIRWLSLLSFDVFGIGYLKTLFLAAETYLPSTYFFFYGYLLKMIISFHGDRLKHEKKEVIKKKKIRKIIKFLK